MNENIASPDTSKRPGSLFSLAVIGVVALGVVLRLAQYLHNRALWLDEAALALQVIYKTPAELIGPLSWHQNSPLGFLLAVKSVTEVLGTNEYALRLLPIVSGVLAMPLFAVLLWQSARDPERFRWETVLTGLVLFAVGKHLIYYSSELRHYAADVMVVCLLQVVSHWTLAGESLKPGRIVALAALGLAATWLVLSSIFVLAAVTAAYGASAARRGHLGRTAAVAVVGILWLASFWMHLQIVSGNIESRGLQAEIDTMNAMSWAPAPVSADAFKWYRESFDLMFYHPVGLTYRGLGGFAFLVGLIALWRRDKVLFSLIVLPIAFALAASFLHRYPFRDRYIHFLAPLLVLAIAEGVGFLADPRRMGTRLVGAAIFLMLALQPAAHGLKVLAHPRGGYEIKPLLAHLTENWDEADAIYVPLVSVPPFLYYWPRLGLDAIPIPQPLLHHQTETVFPGLNSPKLVLEPDFASGGDSAADPALTAWRDAVLPPLLDASHSVWILYEHDADPPIATRPGETDGIGHLLDVQFSDGATLYRYESASR